MPVTEELYAAAFKQHDSTGHGLRVNELKSLLAELGWTEEKIASDAMDLFFKIDTDGDWRISLDEFCTVMDQEDEDDDVIFVKMVYYYETTFKKHDTSGQGLRPKEMKALLSEVGWSDEKIKSEGMTGFFSADTSGDFRVSLDEFTKFVSQYTRKALAQNKKA